jgi:hypothetical protein
MWKFGWNGIFQLAGESLGCKFGVFVKDSKKIKKIKNKKIENTWVAFCEFTGLCWWWSYTSFNREWRMDPFF